MHQNTSFYAPNYFWNVSCPYNCFFLYLFFLVQPSFETFGDLALPLRCTLSLLYPILQALTDDYRAQNSNNRNAPLSRPSPAGCQQKQDCSPICPPSSSTHGRRMTSTRLLKTVSADRHEKRGVNTLTVKKLPTA